MKRFRNLVILVLFPLLASTLVVQQGFTNETRALYILDISRYVLFNDSVREREEFIITVLEKDSDLYFDLDKLSKTRKEIQGKPIAIRVCADIQNLQPGEVVFLKREDGFLIDEVIMKIKGANTLLISEGYPFRSSMINFVVIDGKPRFEANEELMIQEGLYVNELFLSQAIKTREDWESLYEVTEDELELEKSITEQQYLLIEQQQDQIRDQELLIWDNRETLEKLRSEIEDRETEIEQKTAVLKIQEGEIASQSMTINDQVKEVSQQREILADQEVSIRTKEEAISLKEEEIRKQDEKIVWQAEAIQKQRIIILAVVLALLLVFGLGYFIWRNYRNKKRANILLQAQRDQIAYQKKHITDSIEYAKRIQTAILPSLELFSHNLEHFVLFKPRDIVSGDFYWAEEIDGKYLIVTADCTGHGVPGAFMSMLGISLLNEIIISKEISRPDLILNRLRDKIIDALKQETGSIIKDGMDMTVCLFDRRTNQLQFSGANNPLYLVSDGQLTQIKGDKMPVAIHEVMDPFSLHQLKLKQDDTFYTFSDGFSDQFGGPAQKKFLAKNFRNLLLSIQELPMIEQGNRLDEVFADYRKELEQVDDVVIIGVKA
ncbi:MAG: YfiR/HmsC family protein [Bacteroidales bacterium]|nr:YfiR/HmsC family protein [Bacteroidales bacterium]